MESKLICATPALSPREHDVLMLCAKGNTDDGIAEALHIRHSTVRFHMRNACTKLDAVNRRHAIYRACSLGCLGPEKH